MYDDRFLEKKLDGWAINCISMSIAIVAPHNHKNKINDVKMIVMFLLHYYSSDPKHSATDMHGFHFCQMPEHNAASQHREDLVRQ